jgi:hypothetical protein
MLRSLAMIVGLGLVVAVASPARAAFHLWKINEIYSNADGSVQFVELMDQFNGENFLGSLKFQSTTHTFTFPANLPSSNTAGKRVLIATPGFASLPGAVTPDYTFPSANFLSTIADNLNFAGGLDTVVFGAGQLPTDGLKSIDRNKNLLTNSPTNFAGQVGSLTVSLPGDLDGSGGVDRADAAILAANYGLSPATASLGDLTGDGIIGLADLAKLQASLSPASSSARSPDSSPGVSSPAAIPEPATWLPALLGIITLVFSRRLIAAHAKLARCPAR